MCIKNVQFIVIFIQLNILKFQSADAQILFKTHIKMNNIASIYMYKCCWTDNVVLFLCGSFRLEI